MALLYAHRGIRQPNVGENPDSERELLVVALPAECLLQEPRCGQDLAQPHHPTGELSTSRQTL